MTPRQKVLALGLTALILLVAGFYEAMMTGNYYIAAGLAFLYVAFLVVVNLFGPRTRKETNAGSPPTNNSEEFNGPSVQDITEPRSGVYIPFI